MMLINVLNRLPAKLLQHAEINIGQLININTSLSHFKFAQICQYCPAFFRIRINIERKSSLPGGKPENQSIAFVPARILVMIIAETDNGWSPHFRFFTCDIPQQFYQLKTILFLLLRVSKRVDEFVDVRRCIACFGLCHILIVFFSMAKLRKKATVQLFTKGTDPESQKSIYDRYRIDKCGFGFIYR